MKLTHALATVIVSLGTAATAAHAGHTTIKPHATEDGQLQVLQTLYGGEFADDGLGGYSNGALTVTRLTDAPDAAGTGLTPQSLSPLGDDEAWSPATYSARAVARFSNNAQTFGYDDGSGGPTSLFDVGGFGYDVTGSAGGISTGDLFSWTRSGDSGTHFSQIGLNDDGRDHLVTYQIDGLADGKTAWLLFWEDLTLGDDVSWRRTSYDFNDLVIEVRLDDAPVAVPLPPALLAGLAGLGMASAARRAKWLRGGVGG